MEISVQSKLQFFQAHRVCGANRGSGLCCFVSSQVVCWWSIRCFIATVKLRTAQVAFYRTAGGKDGAGGFCVASYCSHRSQVRCLSSAGSLISHYISRCIVYDFTSMGNKLVSFAKTQLFFFYSFIFFFCNNNKILTIVNNKLKAYNHPHFVFQNQSSSFEGLIIIIIKKMEIKPTRQYPVQPSVYNLHQKNNTKNINKKC